jgi:hypothetical protein
LSLAIILTMTGFSSAYADELPLNGGGTIQWHVDFPSPIPAAGEYCTRADYANDEYWTPSIGSKGSDQAP